MKKLGQIVWIAALVLLAAQPIMAALPVAASCAHGMPNCASMTACCGDQMASMAMPDAQLQPPAPGPCQPRTCAAPAPTPQAILTAVSPVKRILGFSAVLPAPPLETASRTLLHRPPHPQASSPPLSILLQVFRI